MKNKSLLYLVIVTGVFASMPIHAGPLDPKIQKQMEKEQQRRQKEEEKRKRAAQGKKPLKERIKEAYGSLRGK